MHGFFLEPVLNRFVDASSVRLIQPQLTKGFKGPALTRRRSTAAFDAIDGERTIGEILREHGHPDTVRGLFERLWWYDQVVFDASQQLRGNCASAVAE
jgi:hypothetical protein